MNVLKLATIVLMLTTPAHASTILVDKSDRTLTYNGATYRIVIGKNPEGHKVKQGDMRTPEGKYLATRRECPKCVFKRAYVLNYPNRKDRTEGRTGGGILIHNGVGPLYWWTAGCIAVSNEDFDKLWAVLPKTVMVEIRP